MAAAADGCELWRECVRWLVDVGILPPNHKVAQPDHKSTIEFALLLRDGILLCRLINELIPGSVDIKEVPQQHLNSCPSEFQCQKIICLFLGACQKSLNLKDEDLFVAYELYKATNFSRVLNTLSIISYSEPSLKRGIKPFPPQTGAETCRVVPTAVSSPEEDIYKRLEDDVDNVEVDSAIYDVGPYKNTRDDRERDEQTKIYDHIVARQDSRREFKTDPWSQFSPTTKREHCIKELLDTEKNYVEKALTMIMNKFHAPMSSFLQPKDRDAIFLNISELWNLHISFQNDLQEAVFRTLHLNETTNGRPKSLNNGYFIGDVFKNHKEKFIAYGPYCMGLDSSRAKILELEKSDASIKTKIRECTQKVNDNQFMLQDLLCLPMQRVLKYHILLSELIKNTPLENPDRKSLEVAKDAMEDINAYINEMKRDDETCNLIKDVEKSITDLIMPENLSLQDYGRLNTDCEVRLSQSAERDSGKMKQRHVFVFDKVLIICQSKKNNTYVYKGAFVLNELTIDYEHSDNRFGTITKKLAGQNMVYITRDPRSINNPDIRYITLAFKTKHLMEKWMDQFKKARDNTCPPEQLETKHKCHYQTFKTNVAHKCSACERLLRGLIFQGYRCEICCNYFHRACIALRPCAGSRRQSQTITPSNSFSSNDLRRRHSLMYGKGDQIVATANVNPNDSSFLPLNLNDILEVITVTDEGFLLAFPTNNRTRQGLVNVQHIRKVRTTQSSLGTPIDRIGRKESTVLPRRPLMTPITPVAEYMNTEVQNQVWYMGCMERPESEKKLKPMPNGTFLVRFSNNRQRYALSISYEGEVKHTVIEQSEEMKYFLDEGFVFNSIVELVNYYKVHNLCESFNSLNTVLKNPYRDCKVFRVIHDFSQEEPKFLSIRKGDILTLVDTVGEDRGWWKGALNNRVGFFPLTYVEELREEIE